MKTIWELFIVSIMGVLIFSGVATINSYMFLKGSLDEESQNMVIKYDVVLGKLVEQYNSTYDTIYQNETSLVEVETDVNTLDAFVKEYGEAKQKIGIIRSGLNMVSQIPDMIFLAIPFVEEEDLAIYKQVLFIIILFVIGIAIIVALFQRRVSD